MRRFGYGQVLVCLRSTRSVVWLASYDGSFWALSGQDQLRATFWNSRFSCIGREVRKSFCFKSKFISSIVSNTISRKSGSSSLLVLTHKKSPLNNLCMEACWQLQVSIIQHSSIFRQSISHQTSDLLSSKIFEASCIPTWQPSTFETSPILTWQPSSKHACPYCHLVRLVLRCCFPCCASWGCHWGLRDPATHSSLLFQRERSHAVPGIPEV